MKERIHQALFTRRAQISFVASIIGFGLSASPIKHWLRTCDLNTTMLLVLAFVLPTIVGSIFSTLAEKTYDRLMAARALNTLNHTKEEEHPPA